VTKKPLKLKREEEKWLEDRRQRREEEERRKEEEKKREEEEEAARKLEEEGEGGEGSWDCKICGKNNGAEIYNCIDCGRPGRPERNKDAEEVAREDAARKERAAKLVEPMPATLVLTLELGGPGTSWKVRLFLILDDIIIILIDL
jgi:hypothetical protein